jgi:hypothetical protein
MERILQRGGGRGNFIASAGSKRKATAATRALILTPTRELAAQCLGMMTALVQFTDISSALIVGGSKNVASQVCYVTFVIVVCLYHILSMATILPWSCNPFIHGSLLCLWYSQY